MGATGLEPATSGVAGLFPNLEMNDGGLESPYSCDFSEEGRVEAAWLSAAIPDVCCPIAARPDRFAES